MGLGEEVLRVFKEKSVALSTSSIVRSLYKEECAMIEETLSNSFCAKREKIAVKRLKAQLHRRVLYYLSKFVREGVLSIASIGENGQKHFVINSSVKRLERTIGSSDVATSHYPLPFFNGTIRSTLQLNAVLIDLRSKTKLQDVKHLTLSLFALTNDVIGLYGFEAIVNGASLQAIINLLDDLDGELVSNRLVSNLLIDVNKVTPQKLENFLDAYSLLKPNNFRLVFLFNKSVILQAEKLLGFAMRKLVKEKTMVFLHNKDVHHAPFLMGQAGVYTIGSPEWSTYCKTSVADSLGLCLSQVSVNVNFARIVKEANNYSEVRQVLLKQVSLIVEQIYVQRINAEFYFSYLAKHSTDVKTFFGATYNYVRLTKYHKPISEDPYLFDLLLSCKEQIKEQCCIQETIFKSCGMPTRMKVLLGDSSTFYTKKDLESTKEKYFLKESDSDMLDSMISLFGVRLLHKELIRTNDVKTLFDSFRDLVFSKPIAFFVYINKSESTLLTLNEFIE